MASRYFCPNCDVVPLPRTRFCTSCGARVEFHPPHVALMLLVYLVCAPLAWGLAVFMIALGAGDSADPPSQAQVDAAFRTARSSRSS
jgi:hypothetical protein